MRNITRTKPRFDTKLLEDLAPQYAVILWNDAVNSQIDVVVVLVNVMRWEVRKATTKMLEVHNAGKSLLIVTHKERAEHIAEQLKTNLLTATIEEQ